MSFDACFKSKFHCASRYEVSNSYNILCLFFKTEKSEVQEWDSNLKTINLVILVLIFFLLAPPFLFLFPYSFICLLVHSGVTSCGAFWYLWNLIWNLDSVAKRSEFIFQWTIWIWEGRRNWWIYFVMFPLTLWRNEQYQFYFFSSLKKDIEALI